MITDTPARLEDGTALVTGAGAGLGRALAIELCQRGIRVVGFGRRGALLSETATMATSGRFRPMCVDVSDHKAVASAFSELDRTERAVTVLINNAAVYERFDFLDSPPERFMHAVAVNLGGVVNCCHAALQRMTEHGFGRIVNVTTFADLGPLPASGAYSVSKGAARIFTRALIADVSDRFPDIVISDWVPGALATTMGIPDGIDPGTSARWGARLALMHDRSLNGTLFDQDIEMLPPRSKKQQLKDLVLLRRRPPARRLSD